MMLNKFVTIKNKKWSVKVRTRNPSWKRFDYENGGLIL